MTADAPRRGGMLRSSAIYSGLTMVSRFLGFLRDLVIAARMGASATIAADAYFTANAFPNLFRRIFAEGAFAAAFVPAYSKSLEADGEAVADRLAADAMATLAAATIVITIVCQLAMPWLMYLISPGYASNPAKFKLAIILTQITMPYLPCMAVVAHLSGVLNARSRFVLSALAPVLLNLITMAFILPQKGAVAAAQWGSIGYLAAGVAQAALLWWGVERSGAKVHWRLPRLTPEIKRLIGQAVPGALAASATQVNIFISGWIASFVPGGRTWLNVADRLYQLPLALVGVAIGVALLPRLSRAVHARDEVEAQGAMDQAITFAMALTLPAAAALIVMPFFLIDALFTRGMTHSLDARQTANALFFYGFGTPAFVLAQLYSRAFFARQDMRTPMRSGLISVAVNIGLGLALFPLMGVGGIAAATAVAAWINLGQMAQALASRGAYATSRATWMRLARILAAAAAMATVLGIAAYARPTLEALVAQGLHALRLGRRTPGTKEIALALVTLTGAALYPPLLLAFGGLKLSEIKAAVRRRPGRTLGADVDRDLGETPAGPGLL